MSEHKYRIIKKGRIIIGGSPGHLAISLGLIVIPCVAWLAAGYPLSFKNIFGTIALPMKLTSALLIGVSLVLLLVAAFRDPGFIPPPATPEPYTGSVKTVDMGGLQMSMKYCASCLMLRPMRTHHCSTCNACCQRFDHHCPYTGTCIGRRNYHIYIVMLEWLLAALSMCSVTSVLIVVWSLVVAPSLHTLVRLVVDILVIIAAGFFTIYIGQLVAFHTRVLIPRSLTTHEVLTLLNPLKPSLYSLSAPVGLESFRRMRHRTLSLVRVQSDPACALPVLQSARDALWGTAPDMVGPLLLPQLAERVSRQRPCPEPYQGAGLPPSLYEDLRLQSTGYIVNVPLVAEMLGGEAAGALACTEVGLEEPVPSAWEVDTTSAQFRPHSRWRLGHVYFIRTQRSQRPRCVAGTAARRAHRRYLKTALRTPDTLQHLL